MLPTETIDEFNDLLNLGETEAIDNSTSEVRYEYEFMGGQILQVRIGDITEEDVDVIVCPYYIIYQHHSYSSFR